MITFHYRQYVASCFLVLISTFCCSCDSNPELTVEHGQLLGPKYQRPSADCPDPHILSGKRSFADQDPVEFSNSRLHEINSTSNDLIGQWSYSSDLPIYTDLEIFNDGKFSKIHVIGGGGISFSGTWDTQNSNQIRFHVTTIKEWNILHLPNLKMKDGFIDFENSGSKRNVNFCCQCRWKIDNLGFLTITNVDPSCELKFYANESYARQISPDNNALDRSGDAL